MNENMTPYDAATKRDMRQMLVSKKETLEHRLRQVEKAIELVDKNPELTQFMDIVHKAGSY